MPIGFGWCGSGSPAFWHWEYGQPIHTISHNHVTRFEHCSSDNRIVLFTHQIWSITIALLGWAYDYEHAQAVHGHHLWVFGSLGDSCISPKSHSSSFAHQSLYIATHCYTIITSFHHVPEPNCSKRRPPCLLVRSQLGRSFESRVLCDAVCMLRDLACGNHWKSEASSTMSSISQQIWSVGTLPPLDRQGVELCPLNAAKQPKQPEPSNEKGQQKGKADHANASEAKPGLVVHPT